jgi:hypothetical protein
MKKFTIIIDVFYKLEFFKISLDAILRQSYKNLEIIIINNAASQDIVAYISSIRVKDNRVKVINYKENVFDIFDPMVMVKIYHDALLKSEGDYVFYNSYDDVMALDYVERMVVLFSENKNSISAAGRPVSINDKGIVNLDDLNNRISNFRSRHMPGYILALDGINKNCKNMFSSPGTIFSFKTKELIELGGYHKHLETSQLIGVVPFGDTSFDENAIFYWRRHENQLNLTLGSVGFNDIQDFKKLLVDWSIFARWKKYHGKNYAKKIVYGYKSKVYESASNVFLINLFDLNFKSSLRTFRDGFDNYLFWKYIFLLPIKEYKFFTIKFVKTASPLLKPIINSLNRIFGSVLMRSTIFKKIYFHVNCKKK